MQKNSLAGFGNEIISRSRRGRAHDMREPDKITLRSSGFIVQIKQARQPIELVVECLTPDLKLIADLLDVVVQRASDEFQRDARGKGARAVGRDHRRTVDVDEVR